MADYLLSKAAEEDLDNIYEFGFDTFGETQADKFYDQLLSQLINVARNPYRYPLANHPLKIIRRSVFEGLSIYYRLVDDDTVEIVRILGRQSLDELSK